MQRIKYKNKYDVNKNKNATISQKQVNLYRQDLEIYIVRPLKKFNWKPINKNKNPHPIIRVKFLDFYQQSIPKIIKEEIKIVGFIHAVK